MVVRRTLDHIRTRPHHERHAVALTGSIIVMVVVFFIWGFFFFKKIQSAASDTAPVQTSSGSETVQ